jgi:hypothetical protein
MNSLHLRLVPCLLLGSIASGQVGYVVDSDQDQLYSIDLATGNTTLIGSTLNNNLGTPAGLAWRDDLSELWTVDLAGGEVGPIDIATGTFTPVFQTALSGWQGISWDAANSRFVLANQSGTNYELDIATGTTTALGPANFGLITAMDFDPSGALWGLDFTSGAIVSIDLVTGAGTQTGTTTQTQFQGFAIDDAGTWYGIATNSDSLYTIDPATGVATLVGTPGTLTFAKGFEIPTSGGMPPIGMNYCTANPNSTGATGRIDAFGSRTVSNNDVTLVASSLPTNAFLFFLTSRTQGFVQNPGGSAGNLCLGGSIGRYVGPGQVQNTGAVGEASLVLNLNQMPQPGGFVMAMPGDSWNFQAWHRDVVGGNVVSNFTDGTTVVFQ